MLKTFSFLLCVAALAFCLAPTASAQWHRISPDTGRCWAFYVHGDSIVSVSNAAFDVSYDAGANWHHVSTVIPGDSFSFSGLTVAPTNFSIWYAAKYVRNEFGNLRVGVYRSTDAGEHWEHRYTLPDSFAGVSYWGMKCSWGDANTVFAVMGGYDPRYLYRSQDGGLTWIKMEPHGVEDVLAFVQDQKDTALVFALTAHPDSGYYRLFWSTNSGDSWSSEIRNGHLGDVSTPKCLFSGLPNRGDFYYHPFGYPGGGLHHTSNFGVSWDTVDGDLPSNLYIGDVVFDPRNTEHQFATVQDPSNSLRGVLFRNQDGWHQWPDGDSVPFALVGDVYFDTTAELFYLGNLSGLWVHPTNTTSVSEASQFPDGTAMLKQNWPNPVRDKTNFSIQLPPNKNAVFSLYDIKGTLLMTESIPKESGGRILFTKNLTNFPNGEYFYSITVGTSVESRKLIKAR